MSLLLAIAVLEWSPTSCNKPGSQILSICVQPFLPCTLMLACRHKDKKLQQPATGASYSWAACCQHCPGRSCLPLPLSRGHCPTIAQHAKDKGSDHAERRRNNSTTELQFLLLLQPATVTDSVNSQQRMAELVTAHPTLLLNASQPAGLTPSCITSSETIPSISRLCCSLEEDQAQSSCAEDNLTCGSAVHVLACLVMARAEGTSPAQISGRSFAEGSWSATSQCRRLLIHKRCTEYI